MAHTIIRILAFLVCALSLGSGAQWLFDPAGAAQGLGMPLLDGLGRSTQIGDLSAFFFAAGGLGLWGLLSRNASLMLAPMTLMGLAAVFRTVAWLVHGAEPTTFILVEIVMFSILLAATRQFSQA